MLQARLQYLLHRRTAPSVAEAAAPPLASAALFDDEQYVVSLFQASCPPCRARLLPLALSSHSTPGLQAAKPSAVHITTSKPGLQLFGQGSQPSGSGSGFVWDEEGHCVTNYHVRSPAAHRLRGGHCAKQAVALAAHKLGLSLHGLQCRSSGT